MVKNWDQAILDYMDEQTESLAGMLAELIRIPTVNPYSGDPDPAGEGEGQRYLRERMIEAGGNPEWVSVPPDIYRRAGILGPCLRSWDGRANLVGRFRFGDGPGPTIVLNAHMDTVGVSDFDGEPFAGRCDGDIIYGRGASDCKCGVVAGLFAIRALHAIHVPVNCEILFESVVDEECNGSGAGTLACCLAGVRGHYALALDGKYGLIYTGCQGLATVEVTVRGRAGHAALGGVSALDKLVLVKEVLDRLATERARTQPGYCINVGILQAGLAPWTVPNHGWLAANLSYAYAEAEAAEAAGKGFGGAILRERFETLLADVCARDEWLRDHRPAIVWVKDLPPFGPKDSPDSSASAVLQAAARNAFVAASGREPVLGEIAGWADATHIVRTSHVPVIGMGAGEQGTAHTATEYNKVSNVRQIAAAVAMAVLRLAGRKNRCSPADRSPFRNNSEAMKKSGP